MGVEIERKFLVKQDLWDKTKADSFREMKQGYLHSDPGKTIRVRTSGEEAFLTIKGKTDGFSRAEYEYAIPHEDAVQMLQNLCGDAVEKVRYYVTFQGNLWEVDVFEGKNQGLIVAEIELDSEEDKFEKPVWIGEEVTSDFRYSNSNLAQRPFTNW